MGLKGTTPSGSCVSSRISKFASMSSGLMMRVIMMTLSCHFGEVKVFQGQINHIVPSIVLLSQQHWHLSASESISTGKKPLCLYCFDIYQYKIYKYITIIYWNRSIPFAFPCLSIFLLYFLSAFVTISNRTSSDHIWSCLSDLTFLPCIWTESDLVSSDYLISLEAVAPPSHIAGAGCSER